jgi:hypothetical protein
MILFSWLASHWYGVSTGRNYIIKGVWELVRLYSLSRQGPVQSSPVQSRTEQNRTDKTRATYLPTYLPTSNIAIPPKQSAISNHPYHPQSPKPGPTCSTHAPPLTTPLCCPRSLLSHNPPPTYPNPRLSTPSEDLIHPTTPTSP